MNRVIGKDLEIDLALLFKLRLVVARLGELDFNKWWNTRGQLGSLGAAALKRGFPRTFHFAQARSVFAVASARCAEVFAAPECVTLWNLPPETEETFDATWETWIDSSAEWDAFFLSIQSPASGDLLVALETHGLIDASVSADIRRLRLSTGGNSVQLPSSFTGSASDLRMLAAGFAKGSPTELVVPYARVGA